MENLKIIEDKLKKINIELIFEDHHDGWYILALKNLKNNFEQQILKIKNA